MPDDNTAPNPDVALVSAFHISDGALVPLATMALETAGIEYELRAKNVIIPGVGGGVNYTGFDADVPGEIFVRADDAARARELLADLVHPSPPAPGAGEPTPAEWQAAAGDKDSE